MAYIIEEKIKGTTYTINATFTDNICTTMEQLLKKMVADKMKDIDLLNRN